MYIFSRKSVPTEFRDIEPNHSVNTSLFNTTHYDEINEEGLKVSLFKIMHSAAVHYQTRFRKIKPARFLNAFLDTISSYAPKSGGNKLYLDDSQSSELQAQSTEVLGVGLSISLVSKLFRINKNRISVIEGSGKRCDFTFEKNNVEYLLESKGRKRKSSIKSAIDDIFQKKQQYPHSRKYGVVSYLPRNQNPVSLVVVDPENEKSNLDRKDLILRLLKYYSREAILAGFWRLSSLLNSRIEALEEGISISEFEDVPLDYQGVAKIGTGYNIMINPLSIETFFNPNKDIGFRHETENKRYFFALDSKLIQILEQQNYSSLLNYPENISLNGIYSIGNNQFSLNTDGSVLACVDNNEIDFKN